jgi:hypothetical protein
MRKLPQTDGRHWLLAMLDKEGMPQTSSATAPASSKSEPAFSQNVKRATSWPWRGGGVASELALPAAGLVPPPPPGAVLMYPKPAVVWFPLLVCGAKAFVLVGAFKPVRLKILVNSARI